MLWYLPKAPDSVDSVVSGPIFPTNKRKCFGLSLLETVTGVAVALWRYSSAFLPLASRLSEDFAVYTFLFFGIAMLSIVLEEEVRGELVEENV